MPKLNNDDDYDDYDDDDDDDCDGNDEYDVFSSCQGSQTQLIPSLVNKPEQFDQIKKF